MSTAASERLSERQFQSIAALVQSRVGIRLPPGKRTMMEGKQRKRVRALGLASLEDYGRHRFEGDNLGAKLGDMINCITTNKTDFFREPAHFDFLRERAVPDLLKTLGSEPLEIWSAACSIGPRPTRSSRKRSSAAAHVVPLAQIYRAELRAGAGADA